MNEVIQFKANNQFTQDHEMLLEKEMKLKDTQMRRLQERVRAFVGIEKDLRVTLENVTKKDKKLVNSIENAVCFG